MSELRDSSSGDSFSETPGAADVDSGISRSVGAEFSDTPSAEPMGREHYADYIRQEPAAEINGYDHGDSPDAEGDESPDDGADSRLSDPVKEAQGMSREEYADYMHQGPAGETDGYQSSDRYDTDSTSQPGFSRDEPAWSDPAAQVQGMAREEYADHMRQSPAAEQAEVPDEGPANSNGPNGESNTSHRDTGTDVSQTETAGVTESEVSAAERYPVGTGDVSPSNQESATDQADPANSEARASDSRADTDEASGTGSRPETPDEARTATQPMLDIDETGTNTISPAGHDDVGQSVPAEGDAKAGDTDPYMRVSIVKTAPDDRTLEDTTPTGIGLKPTGEQLVETDSDRLTRADRFRKTFYKKADDIQDVTEKNVDALKIFLGEHRPAGHDQTLTRQPVIDAPQPPPLDITNIATTGMVAGVVAERAFRWAGTWLRNRKDR